LKSSNKGREGEIASEIASLAVYKTLSVANAIRVFGCEMETATILHHFFQLRDHVNNVIIGVHAGNNKNGLCNNGHNTGPKN
jgi:hypothetical protein